MLWVKNMILLVPANKKRKRNQIIVELNIVKRQIKKIDINSEPFKARYFFLMHVSLMLYEPWLI